MQVCGGGLSYIPREQRSPTRLFEFLGIFADLDVEARTHVGLVSAHDCRFVFAKPGEARRNPQGKFPVAGPYCDLEL